MGELGLTKHANTRADRLSGGQLKRVNVAQELLTKPSLLFLDEPTSGLDPGLDKSVMEQMRDLAHDGRTVIVVTHSVANLDTCDRLLVLVPGGRIAFYGPPDEGLNYFRLPGWAEVFQAFEAYPDRDWAAEFAASPAYTAVRARPAPEAASARPTGRAAAPPPPPRRGAVKQMTTLTRRYVRVIAADRGYLTLHGAAAHHPRRADPSRTGQRRPDGSAAHQPERRGTAADADHLRLPVRNRELGQGAGQGTPDLHQGTGGRALVRRLSVLQAHRARRHQHRAVRAARADRLVRPEDARPRARSPVCRRCWRS